MSKRVTIFLLLFPSLLLLILLFFGGLLLGISQSVGYLPMIGLKEFSWDAYKAIFADEQFVSSLLLTLWLSFSITLLSIIVSIVTALALRKTFTGKKLATFLYQLPLPVPYLVVAIGVMLLFSQSGLIARMCYSLGIINDPSQFPVLLYDTPGVGIILVYLWKQTPFIGLIILSILQSVGNDYEELAHSLGANQWQTFRYVLLPLIIPGIVPASIICFAFTFGSFEVPYLLGKPYPAILSVLAYRFYENVDLNARPQAMAICVFITVTVTCLVFIYSRLTRKLVGRGI